MKNKRMFFSGLLLFCIIMALPALGDKEKVPLVKVTGVVELVGNEPFTDLLITNSEHSYYIASDEKGKLYNLQHRTVTVKGEHIAREGRFANGRSAGIRHTLKNIKIISIK